MFDKKMETPTKKSQAKVMGSEECEVEFREPFSHPTYPVPEEKPPEGRPPYNKKVLELLGAIVQAQRVMIEQLQVLIKASEVELVDLKFDTGIKTLSNAVSNEPNIDDISTTGYTQELIFPILKRLSPELYFINLGPGTIFLRVSKDGTNFSVQSPVFEGEVKTFYDVFELRLRSPTANTQYIITEYEYFKQKDFTFLTGRPYVSETTVAAAGTPNTERIVTDPVQGLGRNAHTGYIINDGPGSLLVRLSNDGATFAPVQTVIPNQILDLTGEDVHTVQIDASANATAYRLALH